MLDWTSYDRFDWGNATQQPLDLAERDEIEVVAAEILGLADADSQTTWGGCSPPGRFAATVVRVDPQVEHRFRHQAADAGIAEIGLKLFKTSADARREGEKVVRFCCHQRQCLPGLPNDHVQQTIDAGVSTSGSSPRHFVLQEWVAGESLEELIRRRWPGEPIDGVTARAVIEQLLARIVVPLWSAGTIWWDFRDANYVWNQTAGQLTMIDVDSLAAYAGEILDSPDVWIRRDKGRATALSRLLQMTIRVLQSQRLGSRAAVTRAVKQAWNDEMAGVLMILGKQADDGTAAIDRFLRRVAEAGMLQ